GASASSTLATSSVQPAIASFSPTSRLRHPVSARAPPSPRQPPYLSLVDREVSSNEQPMALNPIVFTEKVVRSFLRYQLTSYPFADARLHQQMRRLLSLDETRQSPLLKGPFISLSRAFRTGASVTDLISQKLLHPHMRQRIPSDITHVWGHQEDAIRS